MTRFTSGQHASDCSEELLAEMTQYLLKHVYQDGSGRINLD